VPAMVTSVRSPFCAHIGGAAPARLDEDVGDPPRHRSDSMPIAWSNSVFLLNRVLTISSPQFIYVRPWANLQKSRNGFSASFSILKAVLVYRDWDNCGQYFS
jgi:hypothetical protein